jgi:hypothetical protein
MFNGCKNEKIKNIWNVRTQDTFGSFGKVVKNDVIYLQFLQCKNSMNWAMKTHEGGSKVM